VRIGVDLIEIDRVRTTLARYGGFKARCFTDAEREYCDARPNPAQHYAARFAAKEAVGKALGFGVAGRFAWLEIEITGRPKPSVELLGRLRARADELGVDRIELSMTHSKELAAAVAVAVDG
jgi:holo-[acyl-carrier protein] synthase